MVGWISIHSCDCKQVEGLFWDAVLEAPYCSVCTVALCTASASQSEKECVLLNGSVFWVFFYERGCVWIMLNVRLCIFFFYERVCFAVVFVRCWRCVIGTQTVCVCVCRLSGKNASVLWESLSCSLWFIEGCTAFQESVLSVWHSREAPCCCQGPQREKRRTWEFQTPALKLLECSIWGFLFSHAWHNVFGGWNLAVAPKPVGYVIVVWTDDFKYTWNWNLSRLVCQ